MRNSNEDERGTFVDVKIQNVDEFLPLPSAS
jgi:hypothetical protein